MAKQKTNHVWVHSIARGNYIVPQKSASGIDKWTDDTSGKNLEKTKQGSCTFKYSALYSGKVGGLANYISYTPWTEEGVQKVDTQGKKLYLQDKEEQFWGLPKGYLNNRPWKKNHKPGDEVTYFQEREIVLNDGGTLFDLNNFDDRMAYYICLGSKYVANSEKEYRAHKWPYATHYISIENESEEIEVAKNARKARALGFMNTLTFEMQRKWVAILEISGNSFTELSKDQVFNALFKYVDGTTYTAGSNIDKFEELQKLMDTKIGREEIEARHLLKQSLDSRIIWEKSGTYNWPRTEGQIVLGDSYTEAVSFILNPKKQTLVEELEEQIKAKTLV